MSVCPIIYEFKRGTPDFIYSNFYPAEIAITDAFPVPPGLLVGEVYPTTEHAYQAAKTTVLSERREFQRSDLKPGLAKQMGQFVTCIKNWESVKVGVMASLLRIKFNHPALRATLLASAPKMLMEGNYWHDNFWGVCFCPKTSRGCQGASGINTLGRLLMNLREELQKTGGETRVDAAAVR